MTRQQLLELVREASGHLSRVQTALDHLPPQENLERSKTIRDIEAELKTVADNLTKGECRDAQKGLRKIWGLAGGGQMPDCLAQEPSWLLAACNDTDSLLNKVPELIQSLDDIADWKQGEEKPLLRKVIEGDLKALSDLSDTRTTPNCSPARSFLAIRAMETAIYFLQLDSGKTPPQIEKDKHWVDADLVKDFPGLAKAFGKPDMVYAQRAHIVHVKLSGDDNSSTIEWVQRMFRVCGVLWWSRRMGDSLHQIGLKLKDYAAGIQGRIADEKQKRETALRQTAEQEVRKRDGETAIAAKRMDLALTHPVFLQPDAAVAMCPNAQGAFQLFGKGAASIHWIPATGAMMTMGKIRQKWVALGSESGELGYPTSDMQDLTKAQYAEVLKILCRKQGWWPIHMERDSYGKYAYFQNGGIYWYAEKWRKETGRESVAITKDGKIL